MPKLRLTNVDTFKINFNKFAGDTQELAMKAVRKLALDILRNTLRKTPVDTGLLRNSWFVSVNRPATGVGTSGVGNQGATIAGALASLSKVKAGDSIWITNNVEYAPYVELGTSRTPPRLMLRRSIDEALRVFR